MEYGLIFHGMRTGKYYCKNMKYRINIYIRDSQLNRHESVSLASLGRQLCIVRANYVLITRKEGGA